MTVRHMQLMLNSSFVVATWLWNGETEASWIFFGAHMNVLREIWRTTVDKKGSFFLAEELKQYETVGRCLFLGCCGSRRKKTQVGFVPTASKERPRRVAAMMPPVASPAGTLRGGFGVMWFSYFWISICGCISTDNLKDAFYLIEYTLYNIMLNELFKWN